MCASYFVRLEWEWMRFFFHPLLFWALCLSCLSILFSDNPEIKKTIFVSEYTADNKANITFTSRRRMNWFCSVYFFFNFLLWSTWIRITVSLFTSIKGGSRLFFISTSLYLFEHKVHKNNRNLFKLFKSYLSWILNSELDYLLKQNRNLRRA